MLCTSVGEELGVAGALSRFCSVRVGVAGFFLCCFFLPPFFFFLENAEGGLSYVCPAKSRCGSLQPPQIAAFGWFGHPQHPQNQVPNGARDHSFGYIMGGCIMLIIICCCVGIICCWIGCA